MKKRAYWLLLALLILTACGQKSSSISVKTIVSSTSTLNNLPTTAGTPTIEPLAVDQEAILYSQNFETGNSDGLSVESGSWSITKDNGNHTFCNASSDDYSVISLGRDKWKNYVIELYVKALEHHEDPYITIFARSNEQQDYYGALNFSTYGADLSLSSPFRSLGHTLFKTEDNQWYLLRLEVAGNNIKFYIDGQLIDSGEDSTLNKGRAGFTASPHTRMCFDDIRVWQLSSNGLVTQAKKEVQLSQSSIEIVANNTASGDGGNAWGGHQTRIVHTVDGVFTAYTTGNEYLNRSWQLALREEDGTWKIIATGISGREPVNLLASPDGTLHIIGWPNGIGTMWSGKPQGNQISMNEEIIPGVANGDWPYNSAGIDASGDICVLSSVGGDTPDGQFKWACLLSGSKIWIYHKTLLDYRFCYTYVFPNPDGSLSLVSTRDVRWNALGYQKPAGLFDYVSNAFGFWRTDDITTGRLKRVFQVEEKPTDQFNDPHLGGQLDAYFDTNNNMHIIYRVSGSSTNGASIIREAVLAKDGTLINDIQLPSDIGDFPRIFQNTKGDFSLLARQVHFILQVAMAQL